MLRFLHRATSARARVTAVVLAVATSLTVPVAAAGPAAAAADPALVPWSSLLPGLQQGYDPASSDICRAGRLSCVDAVIREMNRRFAPLAAACDHRAVFSLTYLRTTEGYRQAVTTPGFFADPAFLNFYDATFAGFYLRQDDAWQAGNLDAVSPAWRTAFGAATSRQVTGGGDLLLGMNAHINRDLPFALASIGLVAADGTSRKSDHDQVNVFLNHLGQPELAELSRRLDPTMDDSEVQGTTADDTASFQLVEAWREGAWRNAERLVDAKAQGPVAYAAVAASIESEAEAEAQSLVAATSYATSPGGGAARDTWCALHHADS